MRLRPLLLAAALSPLPALGQTHPPAPQPAVAPLNFTERTLPNGLKVYAIRDTSTANVAVHVWYDVGSKNDPQGRSGFAHLFEHLMFKATRNLPAESFDRLTEDVGGYNNASTNDDYTNYFETVPANHLERILFAEADRMASLVVDPASFTSERQVVEEELRLRVLAQPYGKLLYLYYPEISYARHPYARPGIGSIADLDSASIDDVRAFHATYYRPDNAVLVVAGNFDPAQLNAWIDRYFAPIARPSTPIPRVTVAEPVRQAPVSRTVYEPNTPLPAVLISYPLPRDNDPDEPALQVLNAILSAGESSRLYESLVYRQQLAQSAETMLDMKQSAGAMAVYAIMAGGKPVAAGEAALHAELAKLRDAPASAAELTEAKNQIVTSVIRARQTADGKASALAGSVLIDGDPRASDRQLAAIATVTAADVQRVARKYLVDSHAATIRYLPAESAPAGVKGDTISVPATVVEAPLVPPAHIPMVTAAAPGERILPPKPGAPVVPTLPSPAEFQLANGLRVVVVERHDLPLVSASVAVPNGGASDPAGRAGVNALMANLLTKGTPTRSASAIAREIEALGGSIDGNGGWDGSSVDVIVKSDRLAPAMAILGDVAQHPLFAPDELERARAQAIDGVDVGLKDPMQLARLVAARAVFGASPYGHPLEGTDASLKAITRADVQAAYAHGWSPTSATLLLVGDVTMATAHALAERNFGAWHATAPAAPAPVAAPLPAPRVIVVDFPGAGQAGVVVARPGIARTDPRYYPAATANAVLGGGYSSRLNEEIRVKRGLSYGASSAVVARRLPGPVSAETQTKNPSAAEVVDLIVGEMNRLGTEPVPASELDTRKAVLIGDFGRGVETNEGIASVLQSYVSVGVPLDEIKRFIPTVTAVDPAAVQTAAAQLLDPNQASIVVVGEASQFIDALRKHYPQAEVIPASALKLDGAALK